MSQPQYMESQEKNLPIDMTKNEIETYHKAFMCKLLFFDSISNIINVGLLVQEFKLLKLSFKEHQI